MNKIQKAAYIKKFRAYTLEINSTKAKAKKFYNKAGITTPTGKLKKNYSHQPAKQA